MEEPSLLRVLLSLARPGLVAVAIFQFIGVWKEYFFAFMLTGGAVSGSARALPLGLANPFITAQYRTDYGMLFVGLPPAFTKVNARRQHEG